MSKNCINKTWCNLQTYLDLYSLIIFSKFKENYSVGCPKGGGGIFNFLCAGYKDLFWNDLVYWYTCN